MKFANRLLKVLAAGVLTGFVIALPGRQAWADDTVVEGFVSNGALQWPEYIAQTFGWFKENGIKVEMLSVGAGSAQELAAGSLNLGYSGFPDFIRAANEGAPIKIVINGIGQPPYTIYSKPTIKTIADLKGKVVSIGGPKDITLLYTQGFIASAGLNSNDLDFVYAKATPDRLAALVSGAVDAAILYPPFTFRAAAQGFTNLGDIEPHMRDFPFTVWAVNTDWAAKHRQNLIAYVKAYGRAVRWLYDPANKSKAVQILESFSKGDPKNDAATYDFFLTKLHAFSKDGIVSPSVYQKMSEGLVALGAFTRPVPPLEKYFDTSYVREGWNVSK
jgi:ABC-type nitrate/sulfonate/bicarbonate transport system substrate-binding protein